MAQDVIFGKRQVKVSCISAQAPVISGPLDTLRVRRHFRALPVRQDTPL